MFAVLFNIGEIIETNLIKVILKRSTCFAAVVMSSFNGNQMMNLPLDSSGQTDAEEISLRFKTLISTGE